MKQCPKCNTFIDDEDIICDICGNKNFTKQTNNGNLNVIHLSQNSNQVICPHCGSTNIQVVKRGWKITTGFLGSGKNERVCVNCMKKF